MTLRAYLDQREELSNLVNESFSNTQKLGLLQPFSAAAAIKIGLSVKTMVTTRTMSV